jgi:saccharopine dehydrogenase-like NADP-dependent oxidoreductase
VIQVPADEIFSPENTHIVDIGGVGRLEAFPNGDALKYLADCPLADIRHAARYVMRRLGHGRFWYTLAKLGLLEDREVEIQGATLSQRKVLAALLEPKLQYEDGERDLAILRVEVAGRKDGREIRIVSELVDCRDLDTGLMAMNRTVGFTAAVGAQMLAEGSISGRGLLNPWNDIPGEPFMKHLAARGIQVRTVMTQNEENKDD